MHASRSGLTDFDVSLQFTSLDGSWKRQYCNQQSRSVGTCTCGVIALAPEKHMVLACCRTTQSPCVHRRHAPTGVPRVRPDSRSYPLPERFFLPSTYVPLAVDAHRTPRNQPNETIMDPSRRSCHAPALHSGSDRAGKACSALRRACVQPPCRLVGRLGSGRSARLHVQIKQPSSGVGTKMRRICVCEAARG